MDILSFHFWFANRKLFFTKLENVGISQESGRRILLRKKMDADENDD